MTPLALLHFITLAFRFLTLSFPSGSGPLAHKGVVDAGRPHFGSLRIRK